MSDIIRTVQKGLTHVFFCSLFLEGNNVMTPSRSSREIYDQLMDINKQAFGQGYYEVSYHVLAAALHCALLLEEQALLTALEQRASEQRDWIDSSASRHPLSSQSASLHGLPSVYTNLLRQIQTRELMQRHTPPHLETP
jgi:hypothetical protein